MKTLYLCRHAKSSWKHDVTDHQRPLKSRGKRDGNLVSMEVVNQMPMPQKMISSDAVRALSTAKYFKNAYNFPEDEFSTNHDLYDFSGQQVMKVINNLDDTLERVMLFGHNHAFNSIVNMLGNKYIDNLPTCGFVAIEFSEDSWAKVTQGVTIKMIFPRDLKK